MRSMLSKRFLSHGPLSRHVMRRHLHIQYMFNK